jgi:hypothetical protein
MKTVDALCTRASYQPLLAREFISHVKKSFQLCSKVEFIASALNLRACMNAFWRRRAGSS